MLREYQKKTKEKIIPALRSDDTTILCLPTGGGKTVIFSDLATNWGVISKMVGSESKRVMILTDRIELLKQTLRTSQKGFNGEIGLITSENFFIPKKCKLVIGMVETYYRRLERGFKVDDIGLCINDEAHRQSFNKIMLHAGHKADKTIGATATPVSSDIKYPLKDFYNSIVIGTEINDLIKDQYLSSPVYFGTKTEINARQGSFDFINKDLFTDFDKSVVYSNTVDNYYKHALNSKTLIFCVNILHAKKTTASFLTQGFNAKCLVSTDNKNTRNTLLNWFAQTPNAILVNCGILTTGFDEPSIETVILNRATKSEPLYLQMIGRGSRVLPNKKSFKIIDMGNNINRLGFWEQSRDWDYAFWNPKEYKESKETLELSKECPQCEAIQPLKNRFCQNCGYDFSATDRQSLEYNTITEMIDTKSYHYLYSKNPEMMSLEELIQRQKMGSPFSQNIKPYSTRWILYHLGKRSDKENLIREFAAIKNYSETWIKKQLK